MKKTDSASRINIGKGSRADAPAIVKLFTDFYPNLSWSEAYLDWQYYKNPAGVAQTWVAKLGEEIIGNTTAIPFSFYCKGKISLGWRIQDVLTRPAYSGLGVYYRLSTLAKQFLKNSAYPLNFAFPNERSHNGFTKMGWFDALQIPLRILDDLQKIFLQVFPACQIIPLNRFDRHTDEIWKAYAQRIDFGLHRNADYLNWRYFSNPKAKYFPFRLSRGSDQLILILKTYDRENGERWAHLCDLFYSGEKLGLVEAAIGQAIRFAQESGCKALSCWWPRGTSLDELWSRFHFMLQPELNRWLVVQWNGNVSDQAEILQEKRWHLAMGDSDVY